MYVYVAETLVVSAIIIIVSLIIVGAGEVRVISFFFKFGVWRATARLDTGRARRHGEGLRTKQQSDTIRDKRKPIVSRERK